MTTDAPVPAAPPTTDRTQPVPGDAGRPDSGLVTEAIGALSKRTDDQSYKDAFGIITKTEPNLLPGKGTIDFGNGQSIYESNVGSTKGGKTNVLTVIDDQTANGGKWTTAYIGEDGSHQRYEYNPADHTVQVFTGSEATAGKTYQNVLDTPKMVNGVPEITTPNGTVTVDNLGNEKQVAPPTHPLEQAGHYVINGRELPNPPNGGITLTPGADGHTGTYVDSKGDNVTVYANGVTLTDESKSSGKDGAQKYRDGYGREFYTTNHGENWYAYAGGDSPRVGINPPVVGADGRVTAARGADTFSMGDQGDKDHESNWN